MRRVAVVFSGCGHRDGTEITEATSALISLSQYGAQYDCFAPNADSPVKNHISLEVDPNQKRNMLTEAARICRGKIKDLSELNPANYDALVFPGGFGAATNLSNWAEKGAKSELNFNLTQIIRDFHAESKPIGAICIAPVLVAKALGPDHVTVTVGSSNSASKEVLKTGAYHIDCPVDDYITDRLCKVITTPAYMYDDASPFEVFTGINKMIKELVEMA